MTDSSKISRRTAVQVGLGAGAGMMAKGLFARSVGTDDSQCDTPDQPEGPFYPRHEQVDKDIDLTIIQGHTERAEGDVIRVEGQVLDDDYRPVAGALVEIWQANRHGRYHHEDDPNTAPLDPNFQGWGQVRTDAEGRYGFTTIVPGAYPVNEEWWRPPHIHFKVAKRGYHELTTQMYFAGNELNEKDPLLAEVSPEEQARLVVALEDVDGGPGVRRGIFNIVIRKVRTS
jgi:protocatechuate 3,4-dioxygenase beta subunit